ncbi:NADP-dependent oxidoreductase domain-containing protein [Rhodocollybia butyracea]|uniref:NADP-dependent oxidoreductase domain-containing protein n=1 Tax=Rhodocollybia butyracea TaxID=206335 RepID=A0A9P5PHE7_9AGAR|nr:NADP-dependent oxidoreductase domain-containing protein [Rhodocollybia butyracea]
MSVPKSQLKIILGGASFGDPAYGGRVSDIKDIDAILDLFVAHGHCEVDNSRQYCAGTSEEKMGMIDWRSKGLKLGSKLLALDPGAVVARSISSENISHTYDDMKKYILKSLKALNAEQLDIWYLYLHCADRRTDYNITMKAVNELYKEGYFKRFGISNFMSWEVAEIVGICKGNGYITPSVYQGPYNGLHRTAEPELFPCLKKFGISYYAFNPLGGGFFTGRYTSLTDDSEPGSRFDQSKGQGQFYRGRYWNEANFKALASIQAIANKHNLTLAEIALRWLSHHSHVEEGGW